VAKTQPDRLTIKRQLSLWGSVDWRLTNFMTNIIFQTFNIYSRYVGEERGLPRSHDPNTT